MDIVRNSGYLEPLLTGLSLAVVARLGYLWILPKPLPGIPHDPITSILGNIPDLVRFMEGGKKNNADWFNSITDKYGPLSQVLLAKTHMVIMADRAEFERLLLRTKSTEQSTWFGLHAPTPPSFGTVFPTGQLALPTNDMWKRHRQLSGPSMSRRYLEHMSVRVSTAANNLVRLWERKVDLVGSKAFEADKDIRLAIMDTIVSIVMGDSPSSVDIAYASLPTSPSSLSSDTSSIRIPQADPPPLHKALREMMRSVERIQFSPFPVFIASLFTQTLAPSWRKSYSIISEFLNEKITEARKRELPNVKHGGSLATDADCVVDMIAQREAREGAEQFARAELRDELMTFTIAGQDTTAVELSWLVKYLPLDIGLQRRLHEEVCTAFGPGSEDGQFDFEVINDPEKVPLLEAVVVESMRCAQIITGMVRELTNDEVVLGRHIPKGTHVLFPVGRLGVQESDWGPDAAVWRPSRWLRDDGSFNSSAGPSFQFGLGQRACFGQRLAILQLKIFVATLSRTFAFKPLPTEVDSMDAELIITRQPRQCYVSLEKWSTD
ncbi:hypothetical protein FRC07_003311 [Ceratobasidium sp. 392]|nr:hypothetical protein FRC07_003311 [Ceratobasidium sp. 392]